MRWEKEGTDPFVDGKDGVNITGSRFSRRSTNGSLREVDGYVYEANKKRAQILQEDMNRI